MSNRDIIVIGGSAGATVPLKQIVGRLTADLPAAVFIVLHIPAQGIGILSRVASSTANLPVRQAENGMKIEPGQIYLAAPDHHLLLTGDHLFLGRGPRENMVRPAIDALFRSAALYQELRVIGVLLSGLLSDAASGLNAIKRCGGMAVVQHPADAISDEMPLRAMEATASISAFEAPIWVTCCLILSASNPVPCCRSRPRSGSRPRLLPESGSEATISSRSAIPSRSRAPPAAWWPPTDGAAAGQRSPRCTLLGLPNIANMPT